MLWLFVMARWSLKYNAEVFTLGMIPCSRWSQVCEDAPHINYYSDMAHKFFISNDGFLSNNF